MGSACSGKKGVQLATVQPTVDPSKVHSPDQDLADLKQLYDEESQLMNRKVKVCFEVVFAGEASQTLDINMKFINLGEAGALHLSKVLPFFVALKSLRLWKTKLGIEGAKLLGVVLPKLPQLTILSLEDNEIKAEGTSYIAAALMSMPQLSELYLHVNKMGQEGVTALKPALGSKTSLHILTVDENQIAKAGLLILLSALEGSLGTLTLLGLAFNQLSDEGASELLEVLQRMPRLKKMTLSGNNITPDMERRIISVAPAVDFLF